MTHTPIASVTYTASGGQTTFPLPFHVPRSSELVVTVNGVSKLVTVDWTTDSPNLNLIFNVAPGGGAAVVISRNTSEDEDDFPVTFTNGAPITKANLDDAFHYLLHLIQERDDDVHQLEDDIDAIPDGPPGPQGPAGPPGAGGIVWMGTWSSLTTYAIGDAVEFNGSAYIALTATLNDSPDVSPLDWDLLAQEGFPGLVWEGTWSSLTTYAPGDAVTFGGASYIALTTTLNDQPDVSPSDWDVLAAEGAAGAPGASGADSSEEFAFMGF